MQNIYIGKRRKRMNKVSRMNVEKVVVKTDEEICSNLVAEWPKSEAMVSK